jgi:hypothetical protein
LVVLFPKVTVACLPEIHNEEEPHVQRSETSHPAQYIPRSIPLIPVCSTHEVELEKSLAIEVPVDAHIGDLRNPLGQNEIRQVPRGRVVFYGRRNKEFVGTVEIFDGFRVAERSPVSYGTMSLS